MSVRLDLLIVFDTMATSVRNVYVHCQC